MSEPEREKIVGKMSTEALQTLLDELSITSDNITVSMSKYAHDEWDVTIEYY